VEVTDFDFDLLPDPNMDSRLPRRFLISLVNLISSFTRFLSISCFLDFFFSIGSFRSTRIINPRVFLLPPVCVLDPLCLLGVCEDCDPLDTGVDAIDPNGSDLVDLLPVGTLLDGVDFN